MRSNRSSILGSRIGIPAIPPGGRRKIFVLGLVALSAACAPTRVAVARPGPAVGHTVTVLPSGHAWATVSGSRYAYVDGRFYRWVPSRKHYLVVKAPRGAVVTRLPRGHEVRRVGGVTHYVYAGVSYRAERRQNKTVYVVVG